MQKIYNVLCGLLLLVLLTFGCVSLFHRGGTPSETEDQMAFPKITISGIITGSFIEELEDYYAATFPGRGWILERDEIVSTFFDFGDLELETEE